MPNNYSAKHFFLKRILIIMLFHICSSVFCYSQSRIVDSLVLILQNPKVDSVKVNTLYNLYNEYRNTNPDKAKTFVDQGYSLSVKLGYKRGMADNLFAYGTINLNKSNYEEALSQFKRSLEISKEIKYGLGMGNNLNAMANLYQRRGDYTKSIEHYNQSLAIRDAVQNKGPRDYARVGDCYNNLGIAYMTMGDYDRAIAYYLKASKEFEKSDSQEKMSMLSNNLGIIYQYMNNYPQALKYYHQSLNTPDKVHLGNAYVNIGGIYQIQKIYDKAQENFLKALAVNESISNKEGIALALVNLATNSFDLEKLEQAMDYSLRVLKIANEIGDKSKICEINIQIASIYKKQKEFKRALEHAEIALIQGKELNSKLQLSQCYNILFKISKEMGAYKTALRYYKLYTEEKDSLFDKDKSQAIVELQAKYETDNKEKEILLLKKDKELIEKTVKEQRMMRYFLIGGLSLLFLLLFSIYNRYKSKQRGNLVLEVQKKDIEEKNTVIIDSIDYAKTIQDTVLPSAERIRQFFPDSFIFYRPKAIVSGDFYWIGRHETKVIFAVADCSGHGVAGAFMSLLGNSILENIMKKNNSLQPVKILNYLNKELVKIFVREGKRTAVKTSIHISLISIDSVTQQLEFAGAHHAVYLIRNGKLSEIKADNVSIEAKNENEIGFTNHLFELKKDDRIYLFSDGYPNQIGNSNGEEFCYEAFQRLLLSVHQLKMEEQRKKLEEVLTVWKGEREQTDDILVAGITIV